MLIIAAGILLRIVVYFQNNSLFIDEANIARNIYERDFAELTQPLNYEQYAPPVYLWIVKASTLIGGYSEYAYTFYSLVCGILALFFVYMLLKQFTGVSGIWYALLMLAAGPIYVRYSVELKQYISDLAVCTGLILLALRMDILNMRVARFILVWILVGSVAIWLSMPAVFILAAAGIYYSALVITTRKYNAFLSLTVIAVTWLAQFMYYYYTILKPQAETEYLQRCHKDYCFYLLPHNKQQLLFNWNLSLYPLENAGGHQALAVVFHLLCIIVAIVYFARKRVTASILLVAPLILLYMATALHKFTLIPRVTLFALPLILVLIATGLGRLFDLGNKYLTGILAIATCICFINFNALKFFIVPMENEEMKKDLDFLVSKHIRGNQLYVHNLAAPAYIFYTTIHPQKEKWRSLLGGKLLAWDTDYDALSLQWEDTTAMLYSWEDAPLYEKQQNAILSHNKEIEKLTVTGGQAIIYYKQ